MNFFLYMPRPGKTGGRFLAGIVPLAGRASLEVFQDLSSFAARVRRGKDPESIALVFDPTHDDLRGLGALRDFLIGTRILLVLSNQEAETIALAHRLFPTYIAYIDNGLSGIAAILGQLLKSRASSAPPVIGSEVRNPQT